MIHRGFVALVAIALLGGMADAASTAGVIEVAADGSGAFTTIQAAIDAAPDGGTEWTAIHIAAGHYVEKLTVPAQKGPLVLVGDGRTATIIEFDESYLDPYSLQWIATRLLTSYANDLVLRSLMVWNKAREPGGTGGKWDAAVENYGDRLILDDVMLRADHDTLLMYGPAFGAGPGPSRVYVHDSRIQGRGDFIASFTSVFIEDSVLETIRDPSQLMFQQGIAGVAPAEQDGLVVRNSVLTGLSTDPFWPAGVANLYNDARVSLIGNVFEYDLGANRPVVHFDDPLHAATSRIQHFGNTQDLSTLTPLIWDVYSIPGTGSELRLEVPVTDNVFGEPIIENITEEAAAALVPLAHFHDWDPRAAEPRLACEDGVDNDGDGLTDLAGLDPGCLSASDVSEHAPDLACDNGIDDDGDGAIDLADMGCVDAFDSSEETMKCGVGPELALLLPALAWLRRRRPSPALHAR